MLLTFYFESSCADDLSQVIGCPHFVVAAVGRLNIEDDEGNDSVLVRDLDALRWRDLVAVPEPVESRRRIRVNLHHESVGKEGKRGQLHLVTLCVLIHHHGNGLRV